MWTYGRGDSIPISGGGVTAHRRRVAQANLNKLAAEYKEGSKGRNHRLAAGAGLSLGAALGLTATAQATDYTVDRPDDPGGAGGCVLATPNDCSLRQAINDAQSAPNSPTVDRVLFQSGMSGTITLVPGGLFVTDPLDIVGPGANVLAVSGGDIQRVLDTEQATPGDPVTVSGLTLTHGYGSGVVGGGGIYSKDTYLKVISSTVSHSVSGIADYPGGGIRQKNGELLIRNSTISGNQGATAAASTHPMRRSAWRTRRSRATPLREPAVARDTATAAGSGWTRAQAAAWSATTARSRATTRTTAGGSAQIREQPAASSTR